MNAITPSDEKRAARITRWVYEVSCSPGEIADRLAQEFADHRVESVRQAMNDTLGEALNSGDGIYRP